MVSLAIHIVSFVIVAAAAAFGVAVVLCLLMLPFGLIAAFHDWRKNKRDATMNKENQAEYRRSRPIHLPDDRPGDFDERMRAHKTQLEEDAAMQPHANATPHAKTTLLPQRDWLKEHDLATSNPDEYQKWRGENNLPLLDGPRFPKKQSRD
jgi:hypothetical protein